MLHHWFNDLFLSKKFNVQKEELSKLEKKEPKGVNGACVCDADP
jgi:hypothetical protein